MVVLSARSPGTQLGLPPDLATTVDEIWSPPRSRSSRTISTAGSLQAVSGAGREIQFDRPQAVIQALERIVNDLVT